MHHDPKRHPNPREYYPDRYANDHKRAYESATTADPTQRDHFGCEFKHLMPIALN